MKASQVLASMLFASLGVAAPVEKRAYETKTELVVETVVVYTTVWGGEAPAASATSAGAFYENPQSHHKKPSSAAVQPTSAYTPPAAQTPSSVYTPPAASTPSPQPTPSSVYTPPAVSTPAVVSTPSPAPQPSSVYTPPAAPSSAAAAAPSPSAQSQSSGSGATNTGSYTLNYYSGGTGACGKAIQDTDLAVALAVDTFGDSTYDPATGNPTNKYCGMKIIVTYNGVSSPATIMDRCSGCTGAGLDATKALWDATTGGIGGASGDRLESGMTWVAA